jgi:hypothetical protein
MKKDYRVTVNMDRELYELLERYSGVMGTSMSEVCYSLFSESRDRLKPLVELVEGINEAIDSGDVKRTGVLLAELEALTASVGGAKI